MAGSRRFAGLIGRSLALLAIAVGLIATIAASLSVVVDGFILTAAALLTIGVVYCVVSPRDASLHGRS
jgi:hypothetical protein